MAPASRRPGSRADRAPEHEARARTQASRPSSAPGAVETPHGGSAPSLPPGAKGSQRGRPKGQFTQHRRMTDLHAMLRHYPKGITVAEVAAQLRVTPRSARRYLTAIAGDLETVADDSGQKRWRIPPTDVPRRVALRRSQAYALLAARGLFAPFEGTALFEEIALAGEALMTVARRPGRGPNAGVGDSDLDRRFAYAPFAPMKYDAIGDQIDTIFRAVANLTPLRCRLIRPAGHDAQAGDGRRPAVTVHPYAMLLYKESIWVIVHDPQSNSEEVFPVEALSQPRCLEGAFTLRRGFKVSDWTQGQFGLWDSTRVAPQRVRIKISPEASEVALRRQLHATQEVERMPDGSTMLTMHLGHIDEVGPWVLGFGHHAEVLEPASLRKAVADELRAAADRYRET